MKKTVFFTLEKPRETTQKPLMLPLLAIVTFKDIRIRTRLGYRLNPSDWMEQDQRVQNFFMADNDIDADEVNALLNNISLIRFHISAAYIYLWLPRR